MKFILSMVMLFLTNTAFAQRYALLIGISEHENSSYNLEGPVNDILSLKEILVQQRGFVAKNITTLKNQQATKQQIKKVLNEFAQRLTKDDYFVFYFSGHGSSYYDPCNSNKALTYDTGALVPSDAFHQEDFLITKNDLRPAFEMMDKKGVNGLGLIDACFSGNSYRSLNLGPQFTYRYAKLPYKGNKTQCPKTQSDDSFKDTLSYPYKNFVFMTASTAHEKALDLDGGLLRHSFGHVPHGAFTSAILYALDSQQSYTNQSFFKDIQQRMEAIPSVNHSPQLLPKDDMAYKEDHQWYPADNLYEKKLFTRQQNEPMTSMPEPSIAAIPTPATPATPATPPPTPVAATIIYVHIPARFQTLIDTIHNTQGLSLVEPSASQTADYKVRIDPQNQQQLLLTDVHGITLFKSASESLDASEALMAEVLKQQVWLSRFKKAKNPEQPFAIRITTHNELSSLWAKKRPKYCLEKKDNPSDRTADGDETFIECEVLKISVKLDKSAYLVVLDLTANGEFSLLYPYSRRDKQRVPAGPAFSFYNVVGEPFGVDTIVALAFESAQDPLYKQIIQQWQTDKNALIKPGGSLHKKIVQRFTTADKRHAQHIKNIITIKK